MRDCSPNSLLLHNQRWRLLVHRAVLKLESTLVSCLLVGKRRKSCSDLWKSATVNLSLLYRANHRWPNFLMSLKISVWYDFFKVVSGIVLQVCSEFVLGCWSLFIPFLSRGVSVMFRFGLWGGDSGFCESPCWSKNTTSCLKKWDQMTCFCSRLLSTSA